MSNDKRPALRGCLERHNVGRPISRGVSMQRGDQRWSPVCAYMCISAGK